MLRYRWADRTVLVAANLAEAPVSVGVHVADADADEALRLLTNGSSPIEDGTLTLDLGRYGFSWVRVA